MSELDFTDADVESAEDTDTQDHDAAIAVVETLGHGHPRFSGGEWSIEPEGIVITGRWVNALIGAPPITVLIPWSNVGHVEFR